MKTTIIYKSDYKLILSKILYNLGYDVNKYTLESIFKKYTSQFGYGILKSITLLIYSKNRLNNYISYIKSNSGFVYNLSVIDIKNNYLYGKKNNNELAIDMNYIINQLPTVFFDDIDIDIKEEKKLDSYLKIAKDDTRELVTFYDDMKSLSNAFNAIKISNISNIDIDTSLNSELFRKYINNLFNLTFKVKLSKFELEYLNKKCKNMYIQCSYPIIKEYGIYKKDNIEKENQELNSLINKIFILSKNDIYLPSNYIYESVITMPISEINNSAEELLTKEENYSKPYFSYFYYYMTKYLDIINKNEKLYLKACNNINES